MGGVLRFLVVTRRLVVSLPLICDGCLASSCIAVSLSWGVCKKEGVGPAVIGAIGLGTMGYAFKYLWAPGFQRAQQAAEDVSAALPRGGRPEATESASRSQWFSVRLPLA